MTVRKVIAVILTVILALSSAALAVSEPKKVTKMKFKKSLITVRAGEEQKLQLVIKGKGKKPKLSDIVFDHSDVISVTYYAKKKPYFAVKGLKEGTTTITATLEGVSASSTVQVVPAKSERVCMDCSTLSLDKGKSKTITAWVEPSIASQSLTWKSSDTSVATVSSSGLVTAVSVGKATITATDSSGKSASCAVTVKTGKVYVTRIAISGSSQVTIKSSVTLTAAVYPSNATNKNIVWKSGNTAVASVSQSGTVLGVSEGTATITATASDGSGVSGSMTVTVVQPAWGAWGAWQDTRESTNENKQEESRYVYPYYYYRCSYCGAHMHVYTSCYTWAGGCGKSGGLRSGWTSIWSTTTYNGAGLKNWHGTGRYYTYLNGELVFKWTDQSPKYQYRYRTR